MEVVAGIHRIETTTSDGRLLCCYLISGDICVLVDAGEARTPVEAIWPYLASRGIDLNTIRLIFITHADTDHFGGTSAVLERTSALVAAHEPDAAWVSDPQRVLTERYGQLKPSHNISYDSLTEQRLRGQLGARVPVSLWLGEGCSLGVGPDRQLHVLHLPGHTLGHLGLYDTVSGVALIGDAALGDGLRNRDGRVVIPPSYYAPSQYLQTLAKLEKLSPRVVLTGHLPILSGEAIAELLAVSRGFVLRVEEAVATAIMRKSGPWTLLSISEELRESLGPWPPSCLPGFARSVLGHLHEFETRGEIVREEGRTRPQAWRHHL